MIAGFFKNILKTEHVAAENSIEKRTSQFQKSRQDQATGRT
jgi:hypothetical protein